MKAKLIFVLFAVVCMTFAVGIGDAFAQNAYPVKLNLNWNNFTPSNVEATAELCDENGDPFPVAIGILLTWNSAYSEWTGTLISDAPEAATIRFEWIEGNANEVWDPASGTTIPIAEPMTILNSQAD